MAKKKMSRIERVFSLLIFGYFTLVVLVALNLGLPDSLDPDATVPYILPFLLGIVALLSRFKPKKRLTSIIFTVTFTALFLAIGLATVLISFIIGAGQTACIDTCPDDMSAAKLRMVLFLAFAAVAAITATTGIIRIIGSNKE